MCVSFLIALFIYLFYNSASDCSEICVRPLCGRIARMQSVAGPAVAIVEILQNFICLIFVGVVENQNRF